MIKKAAVLLICFVLAFLPFKINAATAAPQPGEIISQTAVLIDADTGSVLYDKNMNQKMYPASITKIMTALVAMDMGVSKDFLMTSSDYAAYSIGYNSSHIALSPGEQIRFEDAMYALAIESANDAAVVIAENTAGSEENFAALMNQKAQSLGAVNTNFVNPHGLPDDNHYTTAYDMALITAAALKYDDIKTYFNTNRYDMGTTNLRDEIRQFWNADYFVNGTRQCEGLVMCKTGWTTEAQHTMVTVCERNGLTLIAVVMSSTNKKDKYDDVTKLMDWGFENYYLTSVTGSQIMDMLPNEIYFEDGSLVENSRDDFLTDGTDIVLGVDTDVKDLVAEVSPAKKNLSGDLAEIDVNLYRYVNGKKEFAGVKKITVLLATSTIQPAEKPSGVKKVFYIFLMILLWAIIAFLGFLFLKQLVIIENRRRRRKERRILRNRRRIR